jgi:hypothetical protein
VTEAKIAISELSEKTDSETGETSRVGLVSESDNDDRITKPLLTLPTISPTEPAASPIFLISVDAWRYDHVDAFQPLLDFLGSAATVPDEPRTQGFFTTPSHASMFTGVHPGDYGRVTTS